MGFRVWSLGIGVCLGFTEQSKELNLRGAFGLEPTLPTYIYIYGDFIWDYNRGFKRDTRNLDYGSFGTYSFALTPGLKLQTQILKSQTLLSKSFYFG